MATGKYSAGAIIAAMPFKASSKAPAKGGKSDDKDAYAGNDSDGMDGEDKDEKDTPVCTISEADYKKLGEGEAIDYTGEDGQKMKIVVGEKDEDSGDDEKDEGESADDGMGENQ